VASRKRTAAPRSYSGAVRAQLADIQRARILAAMFEVACERGSGSVSVAHVVERSGVSRRTFYEQFTDREDCMLAALTRAVDEGRREAKAAEPPPLTAEGVVGGVLSVLQSRLTAAKRARLIELAPSLMSMIVLPYLGSAAAKRELDRRVTRSESRAASRPVVLSADPFKEAGIRLTYRTVRVLLAIAQSPGASNRAVGESAGMTDQGQISKLLSRLQRIGLVKNTGLGPGRARRTRGR
jgi:AcrR family transcriptional regulator